MAILLLLITVTLLLCYSSSVEVYLAYVESTSQFYIQYKDCENKIQELQDKLSIDFQVM
jgi:hypothetical protein